MNCPEPYSLCQQLQMFYKSVKATIGSWERILKRKCSGNWIKSCYSIIFYSIVFQTTDSLDNIHWLGSTVRRGIMAMLWHGLSLCVTCCWQNKVHILNTFSVGSRYFFDGILSRSQCFPGTWSSLCELQSHRAFRSCFHLAHRPFSCQELSHHSIFLFLSMFNFSYTYIWDTHKWIVHYFICPASFEAQ